RPVCKFRYQPKSSAVNQPSQMRIPSLPEDDSNMEPEYTFEKAEMIVFNISGGWVAYAINLKKANSRQFYDESGDRNSPDTDSHNAMTPLSSDSEVLDHKHTDMNCIAHPPRSLDDLNCKNYPMITKMRFCTQKEFLDMKLDNK
ncbi:MAG: hypothetical protein ACD_39C01626G0006, partial [uncultured bacterium]